MVEAGEVRVDDGFVHDKLMTKASRRFDLRAARIQGLGVGWLNTCTYGAASTLLQLSKLL